MRLVPIETTLFSNGAIAEHAVATAGGILILTGGDFWGKVSIAVTTFEHHPGGLRGYVQEI